MAEYKNKLRYEGIVMSEKGGRSSNEDKFTQSRVCGSEFKYVIITDGVGNSELSELAAETANENISRKINSEISNIISNEKVLYDIIYNDLIKFIDDTIRSANDEILHNNEQAKEKRGGQTTIDVCMLYKDHLAVSHVGDGRVYLLDETGNLALITRDENAAWMEKEEGKLIPSEITKVHPLSKNLMNALGASRNLPKIQCYCLPVIDYSRILIATDGLYRCLTDNEIREILVKDLPAKSIMQELFDRAKNPVGIVKLFAEKNKVSEEVARIMLRQDNRTAALIKIIHGGR